MAAIWVQKYAMRERIRELMEKRLEAIPRARVELIALGLADAVAMRMTLADQKDWARKLEKGLAEKEPS